MRLFVSFVHSILSVQQYITSMCLCFLLLGCHGSNFRGAQMKIDPSSFLARPSLAQAEIFAPIQIPVMPAVQQAAEAGSGFLQTFEGAVKAVDARTQAASAQMQAVDAGTSDDLVGAMLASQEASLSFSMLMQVRNKVMGAVDEIVKLQV